MGLNQTLNRRSGPSNVMGCAIVLYILNSYADVIVHCNWQLDRGKCHDLERILISGLRFKLLKPEACE